MTALYDADIAMFVHNAVTNDARVTKEASSLAAHGWKVVVVGVSLNEKQQPEVEMVSGFKIVRVMPRFLRNALPGTFGKLVRLTVAVPMIIAQLRRARARIYHGNDFIGLLLIFVAGIWRRPVVYDSHELFFDQYPPGLFVYPLKYIIRLMRPLEKILARRAAAVITVNDSIADVLAKNLGILRPVVLWNAVELRTLEPAKPVPRRDGQKLVGHSGTIAHSRHLAELVVALKHLPDEVGLVFVGDGPLRKALFAQADSLGLLERVSQVSPVTPNNIPTTLGVVDVAVILNDYTQLSYLLSLPNKLFEAVAAGVPVVSSPNPEIAALLHRYDIGVTCEPNDPADIARAIQTVLQPENQTRFRENALRARAALNWEAEECKLVTLYEKLLSP
jgi:glycogen synthase